MGLAMAGRLHEAGHAIVGWNRTPGRLGADVGVEAASPRALADEVEVVISMLTDAAAIEACYHGRDGVLSAPLAGKLVIDMSTVRPEVEIALARSAAERGAGFVECPVGGSVGPARSGTLLGLAGGTDENVARARPVLDALCRRVDHVGPVGYGASLKLAINLPLLVFYQALGEALTLCRHLDLDPGWLVGFFAETSGGANVLKGRGPAIAEALAGGTPATTFDVASIRKDLRTMLAEARARGTGLPLAEATLAVYDEAAAAGWDGRDGAALPSFWPTRAPSPALTTAP
jgi:3-hydroxyisobutyrate dehydrogenase